MPTDTLSTTFSALADPTRRAILSRPYKGESSVSELAKPFKMSMPAVSKHLKVLERAGLATRSREAQWRPVPAEGEAAQGGIGVARRLSAILGAEPRPARRVSREIQAKEGKHGRKNELTCPTGRLSVSRTSTALCEKCFSCVQRSRTSGTMVGAKWLYQYDSRIRFSARRHVAVDHARPGRQRLSQQERFLEVVAHLSASCTTTWNRCTISDDDELCRARRPNAR